MNMADNSRWNKVIAFTSWLIVFALIYSTISLFITPPSGAGPVASAFGVTFAQWFYAVLYTGLASLLAYSKFKKRNELRKKVLLVIYLTGFFTLILTIAIIGPSWGMIDNLTISTAAAVCWLWWKFKTEYISEEEAVAMQDEI